MYIAETQLKNKMIMNELENIFYNIAQTDYGVGQQMQWANCEENIQKCLCMQDYSYQLIGLRCLRELSRANYSHINEDSVAMKHLAENFLPIMEALFATVSSD